MIFGIGLPRTGTNSVAQALRMMGLRAVHWQELGAHVMERWYESDITFPSDVDALLDTCFRRWYRTADRLAPGSRFILTTREKNAWMASCDRWLSRYKPAPGTIWFNRRLFGTGRITYHPEIFSDLYEEHHEAVRRYFQHRDDLLELDVAATPDRQLFEALGDFLDLSFPDASFPHLNRSKP